MKANEYMIAEHYLSALINCDYSGLSDSDTAELDRFEAAAIKEAMKHGTPQGFTIGGDEEPSFERCDVSGLLANCVPVSFMYS